MKAQWWIPGLPSEAALRSAKVYILAVELVSAVCSNLCRLAQSSLKMDVYWEPMYCCGRSDRGKRSGTGSKCGINPITKIIDVSGPEVKEYKGRVPARSVVIPGSYMKKFPAGEFNVSCALIIGQRKPSTDLKTSLNEALREFKVSAY